MEEKERITYEDASPNNQEALKFQNSTNSSKYKGELVLRGRNEISALASKKVLELSRERKARIV